MDIPNFATKLADFIVRLEMEMNGRIAKVHPILLNSAIAEGRRTYEEISAEKGRRFYKVFSYNGSQRSVRYFVERSTGIIFGAASWQKFNPNHEYGTLDTIAEWDWSDYYAKHKQGNPSLVPRHLRKLTEV